MTLEPGRVGDDAAAVTDLASASPTVAQEDQDLLVQALEQLRVRRAALVERSSRAARWQRLAHARLDLSRDAEVALDAAEDPRP